MTVTPQKDIWPQGSVAHERRRHHGEEDEHAEDPEDLTRSLVRPVVETAEDVGIDRDEEHRRADRVHRLDHPAVVHVAADLVDGVEGVVGARLVVHREDDAGDELRDEAEHQDAAERPHVVEVTRRGEIDELPVHEAHDWQAFVKPLADAGGRLIARVMIRHGGLYYLYQPILILVSEMNA